MVHQSCVIPVQNTLLYIVPAAIVVHQSCVIPVQNTLLYIVPSSIVLGKTCIVPIQLTALYIVPAAAILAKACVIPVQLTALYIVPSIAILAKTCVIPVQLAALYIIPSTFILAKACVIPVQLTVFYVIPNIIVLNKCRYAEINLTILVNIPPAAAVLSECRSGGQLAAYDIVPAVTKLQNICLREVYLTIFQIPGSILICCKSGIAKVYLAVLVNIPPACAVVSNGNALCKFAVYNIIPAAYAIDLAIDNICDRCCLAILIVYPLIVDLVKAVLF